MIKVDFLCRVGLFSLFVVRSVDLHRGLGVLLSSSLTLHYILLSFYIINLNLEV